MQGFEHCRNLGEISVGSSGDTDFTPLLQEAQRHRRYAALLLTDLHPTLFNLPWSVL